MTDTRGEPALELGHLVKAFNGKRAVDDISFHLERGRILGLLGPNGAGKTTTLRMILNIIAPDSGTINILGHPFSEPVKDHIGFLPEERGLYRKLTVTETLDFFGRLKSMSPRQIKTRGDQLLGPFDLDAHRSKKVEELSRGMAQKLQFITTILHSPRLLILDEPFSGLDPVNIELVKDVILDMKRQGMTIIFSTHLMDYAEKLVDHVVMIHRGRKIMDGPLSRIKADDPDFIHIKYDGDAAFVKDLEGVGDVRDYGNEMDIRLTHGGHKKQLLKTLIDSNHIELKGFRAAEPSLNDIFIRRVSGHAAEHRTGTDQ